MTSSPSVLPVAIATPGAAHGARPPAFLMRQKLGAAVMSRWVAKWTLAMRAWTRDVGDRGQTSFEYLGIAVVIAVIIGVLASTTDIGDAVLQGILDKIQDIIDAG